MYKVFDKWFFGYEAESHYCIFTASTLAEAEAYIKGATDAASGRNKDDFYIMQQQVNK